MAMSRKGMEAPWPCMKEGLDQRVEGRRSSESVKRLGERAERKASIIGHFESQLLCLVLSDTP